MALKITAGGFSEKRWLKIHSWGVTLGWADLLTHRKRVAFEDIICILMSPDYQLSIQIPDDIFTIATKPYKRRHRETIEALVREVRRAHMERYQRLLSSQGQTVPPQPPAQPPVEPKRSDL